MKLKILRIQNIDIKFKKSLKAKNISICVKPFNGVEVTVPNYLSYSLAEDFVLKKINWIKRNQFKMVQKEKLHTIFDSSTKFNTRNHLISIKQSLNKKYSAKNIKDNVIIIIPKNKNILSSESQIFIRNIIIQTWRKEANHFLPQRIKKLANKYNFKYQKISIRNTKSRWGSCSYYNNISLSLHLMRITNKLIDYVILHELTHTIVKNHSNVFWETLEKVCENSKKLDRELKNYNLSIF